MENAGLIPHYLRLLNEKALNRFSRLLFETTHFKLLEDLLHHAQIFIFVSWIFMSSSVPL